MRRYQWWVLGIVSVLWASGAAAKPVPAWIFSNGAVLQRGQPLPIWGTADPGEAVTVTLAGASEQVIATAQTTTDSEGRWVVRLPALQPGGPFTLFIVGSTTVTLKDILVGDVWVCSGQSNMEWKITQSDGSAEA